MLGFKESQQKYLQKKGVRITQSNGFVAHSDASKWKEFTVIAQLLCTVAILGH
jgi:hypothetical protein